MDTAATDSTVDTVTPAALHGCIIRGIGWVFLIPDITPELTSPVRKAVVTPARGRITRDVPDTQAATGKPKRIAASRAALREGILVIRSRATPHVGTQRLRLATPVVRRAVVDLPAMGGLRRPRTRALLLVTTPRRNLLATHAALAETQADIPADTVTPAVVDIRIVVDLIRSKNRKAPTPSRSGFGNTCSELRATGATVT